MSGSAFVQAIRSAAMIVPGRAAAGTLPDKGMTGALHAVTPAKAKSLQFAIEFSRPMAPFIVQNDLLGGDATEPRGLRGAVRWVAVTLVYRDADLPGDGIGEIDVVRIGGTPHKYAIVSGKRPISLDGQVLCVVGDVRCSRCYVWP